MAYKIIWTKESINNFQEIVEYIQEKFSDKQVDSFKGKFSNLIDLIESNPYLFPASLNNSSLRKAVLSKQTSLYYKIENNSVYLAYIHLNKRNPRRLK